MQVYGVLQMALKIKNPLPCLKKFPAKITKPVSDVFVKQFKENGGKIKCLYPKEEVQHG